MRGAEDEPVHEMCHTLQQALAPGESLAEIAINGEVTGADVDDDNSDNEVYDNTDELDKEAAAVAMNEVDDDAQRVVMASDVDEDELEAPEEETEGDFVAVARQMTADIDKNGFNLLGLYNLWMKGSDQLAKDDIKKKRVGGRRRLNRKLQLARATARAEKAISDSMQNQKLNEDEGEPIDTLWTRLRRNTSKFHI